MKEFHKTSLSYTQDLLQCDLLEISVKTEMFYISAIQHGNSCQSHVAIGHLKLTSIPNEIYFWLHNHMWLKTTVLAQLKQLLSAMDITNSLDRILYIQSKSYFQQIQSWLLFLFFFILFYYTLSLGWGHQCILPTIVSIKYPWGSNFFQLVLCLYFSNKKCINLQKKKKCLKMLLRSECLGHPS